MNYQELLTLIDKLDQSKVAYLEFTQGSDKVVLSKEVPFDKGPVLQTTAHTTKTVQDQAEPLPSTVAEVPSKETKEVSSSENSQYEAINSPIVGVVYLQPQPGEPSYVSVGDEVKKGQTICIIEAMKLMNEIAAPFDGIIREVLVENDNVVEFEQPLFKIERK
uniref:acetyl-CoA carboxylase biotin carboxyl carrier protein n=1 Tax=Globicatella sulfidifaciens TaxID=136093 RepID=UPI0023F1757D|nr:acetyl-CoA carboxylase biotin carboxyl carrier protein [Globicatella sulfidifaciens]